MPKTCQSCEFFDRAYNQNYGKCRYNPPTVVGYSTEPGDKGPITAFPEVLANRDWCREHKEKKGETNVEQT